VVDSTGLVVREYPHYYYYSVVNAPLWGTETDRVRAVVAVVEDARLLMAEVDVAAADQALKN
jgi:hypothetical protein